MSEQQRVAAVGTAAEEDVQTDLADKYNFVKSAVKKQGTDLADKYNFDKPAVKKQATFTTEASQGDATFKTEASQGEMMNTTKSVRSQKSEKTVGEALSMTVVAAPEFVRQITPVSPSKKKAEELEEEGEEDILALLTFTPPSWFEEILAGTGIMTLQYNIQQERMRRNDEFFQNPYPILERIVTTSYFDVLVACIVIGNCFILGVEVSLSAEELEAQESTFFIIEIFFSVIFCLEWWLRVFVFGWSWPFEYANAADTFLVYGTGIFLKPLEILGFDNSALRILTALRILRLVRSARAVRLLPAFKEMWILIHGLMTSFQPLAWVAIIATVVLYVFSVAACELIGRRQKDPATGIYYKDPDWLVVYNKYDNNSDGLLDTAELVNATGFEIAINRQEEKVQELFGDLLKSMLTMLQLMTLDTWADTIAREVDGTKKYKEIEGDQEPNYFVQLFCIAFIGVGVFVFWNLITAVVVGSALKIYSDDDAQMAKDIEQKKRSELTQLKDLFLEMDIDKSGSLTKKEFFDNLKLKEMQETIVMLEMNEDEMKFVWQVLDDGDGELSIKEFTDGIRRMKGEAKAKDIQDVIKRLRETTHRQEELKRDIQRFTDTVAKIRNVATIVQDDTEEVIAILTEMYQRLDWHIQKGEKGGKKGPNGKRNSVTAKFNGLKLPEKFVNFEGKKEQANGAHDLRGRGNNNNKSTRFSSKPLP
jgi:Ca2+-binding EF-hand superfamily protein